MEISEDSELVHGHAGAATVPDDLFEDLSDIDFSELSDNGLFLATRNETGMDSEISPVQELLPCTSVSEPSLQGAPGHPPTKVAHCPICNRSFKNFAGLKCHQRKKHGTGESKTFTCKFCQKVFKYKKQLESHQEAAHKPEGIAAGRNNAVFIDDGRCKFRNVKKGGHNPKTVVNGNLQPQRVEKKKRIILIV